MQTILCTLIVIVALVYVANRWLPAPLKRRLLPWLSDHSASGAALNKPAGQSAQSSACGSCSSCGNCGNASTKIIKK